jgi:hypothetical protein
VADAVIGLNEHGLPPHDPERMLRTGFDAGARADALIGIDDGVQGEWLRDSRLHRLSQANAVVGVLLMMAAVIQNQYDDYRQEVEERGEI